MSQGFLYISADDQYLAEATESAYHVRKEMPDTDIGIITNSDSPGDIFDVVIDLHDPQYSYADKVFNLHRSPFDRTVFLDTDAYLVHPVPELFSMLDKFKLCAATAPGRERSKAGLSIPLSFPQFNTGVIAYRSTDDVMGFLSSWREIYKLHQDRGVQADQPAFRQAAWDMAMDIHRLPPEYNCRPIPGFVKGAVKIIHAHAQSHSSREAMKMKLNKCGTHRVYSPIDDDIGVFAPAQANKLDWLFFSLASNGFIDTIKIAKRRMLSR